MERRVLKISHMKGLRTPSRSVVWKCLKTYFDVCTWKKQNFLEEFWSDNINMCIPCDLFLYVRGKYDIWDVGYKEMDWMKSFKMWLTVPFDNHSNKINFILQGVYWLIMCQALKISLHKSYKFRCVSLALLNYSKIPFCSELQKVC
jgi:hypothetical protein